MTTTLHAPLRDCVNSLGIPVDNLSLDQVVDRMMDWARCKEGRARLVSTLNVDFLVNALGVGSGRARHPELLNVLRNSDLVTADGFPIVWLSRIMGKPLKERVCGSDLVPALAERAAQDGLSLFLLGGGEGVAARAADCLQQRYPGLAIAGTSAPYIHTAGPGLKDSAHNDQQLLAQINSSGADILLVGLGNPKQELWFNRNRRHLRVPVAIGVGGTFEFITGGVSRAPGWMQRMNIEWLYRITQDPVRLWRRYAEGLVKLALLSTPLLYARFRQQLVFAMPAKRQQPVWRWLWSSRQESLRVLPLPRYVSAEYLHVVAKELDVDDSAAALSILDFSAVRCVEMAGQEAFFTLAELQRMSEGSLQFIGMTPQLRRQLASCRVLDLVNDGDESTLGSLGARRADGSEELLCSSYALDDTTLVFLRGLMDADGLAKMGVVESLLSVVARNRCLLDLRGVNLLESSAIGALMPLLEAGEGNLFISGASANTRQMFKVAGLGKMLAFVDDSELLAAIAGEPCDA
ncbi:WecB/TagA/CpsF family glycosyltransferase [Halioglobus maricola]|uniref:WecB/TagA/CpsF family glycosyltransferase n=1 Tax=Halioglobus maricola TaxID=2601894 RepID=A0A5P9NN02_9GAMM|nr:WecB/TagA/CpsF family glycosyltransferase [Halioglobus maricola]QFU77167.1 WecB/TagA/CpsF family glycosyltransferase [Halioglobus maricola]